MSLTERLYGVIGSHYDQLTQDPNIVATEEWLQRNYDIADLLIEVSSILLEPKPPDSLLDLALMVNRFGTRLLDIAEYILLTMTEDIKYLQSVNLLLDAGLADIEDMANWIDNRCHS